MSRNPFDDNSDGDPFEDDPFGDSRVSSALKEGNSNQRLADDTRDAIPLHSVRRSDDAGGFLSNVGFSGGRGGSYKPLDVDVDVNTGHSGGLSKTDSYSIDSREAELRRREEALEARERELHTREVNVNNMANGTRPPLNFPPLYPI
ncbi:hypothetical protein GGI11_005858, partial [Coemansia sp. RSA 2049]